MNKEKTFENLVEFLQKTLEVERYVEIHLKYKKLVFELNQGNPIDWEDENQNKYYCYYNFKEKTSSQACHNFCKSKGILYCTDENFRKKAIFQISKQEDFEWYLKR